MIEARHLFLVPACDAERDGELSVLGVRQARAIGDALGDVALSAVYAAPGLAERSTAEAIAQRHGLVVRPRPGLDFFAPAPFAGEAERIVRTFEGLARVGPGRRTLVVASVPALGIALAHCRGARLERDRLVRLERGSLTEIVVDEGRYAIRRLGELVETDRPGGAEPG